MIGNPIFRKYYFFTAVIVVAFVILGSYASRFALHLSVPPIEGRHSVFFAKIIDQLDPHDRAEGLARLASLGGTGGPNHLAVLGEDGKTLSPARPVGRDRFRDEKGETEESLAAQGLDWQTIAKPGHDYEYVTLGTPFQGLIRFPGTPAQYLFVNSGRGRPRSSTVTITTFASLAISALIGVALALLVLFKSVRDKAQLADSVIAELQKGNLKARFPIHRHDEFGLAMDRFNKMADEIERLVEQLRAVERSRMTLLQELAHDLRTPVASLKNLLETLHSSGGSTLAPSVREEFMELALKETDYFERLVEDLLVLAQVSEPRYLASREAVDLRELLDEEADARLAATPLLGRPKPALAKDLGDRPIWVQGNPQLLRRMIRNTLDNAFSFARKRVSVRLAYASPDRAVIQVQDDGDGFSATALASYGERKVSRVLGTSQGSARLSVGLGSVIIKTVARVHGGEVLATNLNGARVEIRLPTAQTP